MRLRWWLVLLVIPISLPSARAAGDGAKKPREALDAKLPEYKSAKNGRVIEVTDDFMAKAFPKHHFFVLRFAQYPLPRAVEEPLKHNNIFVVDADGKVELITETKGLQKFFTDQLGKVEDGELAKHAASAWLRLVQEIHQDSMFQFKPPQDIKVTMTKDKPPSMIDVEGKVAVETKGGDKGQISTQLRFEKGKLAKVEDKVELQAGIRPICQATKLLDPDPIVRGMAEQSLLVMGQRCREYLDEQRAQAGPELQKAIDRIWKRILDEGR